MSFKQVDPNNLSDFNRQFFAQQDMNRNPANADSRFNVVDFIGSHQSTQMQFLPRISSSDVYYVDPSITGTARNVVFSQIADQRQREGNPIAGKFLVTNDASFLEEQAKEAEAAVLPPPVTAPEAERNVQPAAGPATVRQRRSRGRTVLNENIGSDIILGGN